MSENIPTNTAAERLLSLLLVNDNVKENYYISKRKEGNSTVLHITHRLEGTRFEEHVSKVVIEQ